MTEQTSNQQLITTARNASLEDLVGILKAQQEVKLDAVVPAQAITSQGGIIKVQGLGFAGPVGDPGTFRPTEIADGHLADKLGIPVRYLRELRAARPDLYDANVNGWLQGTPYYNVDTEAGHPAGPDPRSFYVRTFRPADPFGEGIFRALASDRYRTMDHLDMVIGALSGVRNAKGPDGGPVEIEVLGCQLSESNMRIRVAAPGIQALAPTLLDRYISPNGGWTPEGQAAAWGDLREQPPVVFGGFDIGNSETGGGAAVLTPVLTVARCRNGMKFTANQLRHVHLGTRMSEGQVRWSDDTQRKNVELVTSMAQDAVQTFLDPEFVQELLRPVEEQAGKVLSDPAKAVEVVAQQLRFSEEVQAGVLSHFVRGGQGTAGGVLNAVTSFAQELDDPDLADELESEALRALEIASTC